MTDKHLEKIKQLIVAGEDATQGEWRCNKNDYGSCYDRNYLGIDNGIKTHTHVMAQSEINKDIPEHKKNADFITKAANARDSIKWAYAVLNDTSVKRLHTVLQKNHELSLENDRLREALEEVCDGTSDPWIVPIVEKALEGTEDVSTQSI